MGRFSWATSVVAISMLVGGCSFFATDESDLSAPVIESPAPLPSPQPVLGLKPQPNPILIQPTNPEQRLRTLRSGRVDPFRELVPSAKVSASSSAAKSSANPTGTAAKAYTRFLDKVGNQYDTAAGAYTRFLDKAGSELGQEPNSTSPNPVTVKAPTSKPGAGLRLPTLPQPDAARGVQVTGIVSVAGIPRAIVKAPGESVSRSVTVGERLANGQVLVKRIDTSGSEPLVILEQYGTEVAVGVGKTT